MGGGSFPLFWVGACLHLTSNFLEFKEGSDFQPSGAFTHHCHPPPSTTATLLHPGLDLPSAGARGLAGSPCAQLAEAESWLWGGGPHTSEIQSQLLSQGGLTPLERHSETPEW